MKRLKYHKSGTFDLILAQEENFCIRSYPLRSTPTTYHRPWHDCHTILQSDRRSCGLVVQKSVNLQIQTASWYIAFILTGSTLESRLGCILPGWVFILSFSSLPLYWASLSSCMAYSLWMSMCQGKQIQMYASLVIVSYYHRTCVYVIFHIFIYFLFQPGDMWWQPEHHHVSTVWWSVWLLASEYSVLTGPSIVPVWQWSHCLVCYFHVSVG